MKILLSNVHTPYLYSLAQTGHEFYCVTDPSTEAYGLPWADNQRPKPSNVMLMRYEDIGQQSYDVLILQAPPQWDCRFAFPRLPLIYIEHNAQVRVRPHYVEGDGVIVVFNSARTESTWIKLQGVNYRTIEHGVPDEFFPYSGERQVILSVISDIRGRAEYTRFLLWQKVLMGLPWQLTGPSNGELGKEAKDFDELRKIYAGCRVLLSTAGLFPALADLEAMLTGMPVVRVEGVGKLAEVRETLRGYLNDFEKAKSDGQKQREWALEHYNIERFCSKWNEVLNLVKKREVKE